MCANVVFDIGIFPAALLLTDEGAYPLQAVGGPPDDLNASPWRKSVEVWLPPTKLVSVDM